MTAAYAADAAVLSEGSLVVQRVPRRAYPAATRTGVALLGQMITAGQAWDAMTEPQRRLVGDLCAPILAADRPAGDEVTPPELPASTRAGTVASLRRKQLVEPETLRLTVVAVLAAAHGRGLRARRRGFQLVETVTPAGGVL